MSSPQTFCSSPTSSISSSKIQRSQGRSMRTIRSNLYRTDQSCSFTLPVIQTYTTDRITENLTDSMVDFRLTELATEYNNNNRHKSKKSCSEVEDLLDLSQAFSDFSACSSDISGELQRLSCIPTSFDDFDVNDDNGFSSGDRESESWLGFLKHENLSPESFESVSLENLDVVVKVCVDGLESDSLCVKRSAAARLRLLAKNRSENRALIGNGHGGVEANAACALLSLSLIEDNKISIGVCGAIPPLVSLILSGSNRGKKDALTTLYKLCSIKVNKERAVSAGAVKPLVALISEQGSGLAEKAMVVLSSLAGIREGKAAIMEEGGIPAWSKRLKMGP
ncbi:hypothetical protein GIB67_037356 [Kingdonia uniflora]|uniref:U-box domain-containing protein n=1 Tax=Kingdonia uniflora TaxID=39325 RepID=A0A7J7NV39_9MAGN|nr:hypothetical protein GIB67_037356 [Kingdonia uniflora]